MTPRKIVTTAKQATPRTNRLFTPRTTFPKINDAPIVSKPLNSIKKSDIKIIETIGSGSTAKVYLAKHNGHHVAVKELDCILDNEMKMMSSCSFSSFVVSLFAYCNNPRYLVMEYLTRGSLDKILEDKIISGPNRLQLISDIASGIRDMHEKKIIHRDIRSANIFCYEAKQTLRAKVGDLGAAVFSHKVADEKKSNRKMENPLWVAPEVIEGKALTTAADNYSFGLLLIEIVLNRKSAIKIFSSSALVPAVIMARVNGEWEKLLAKDIQQIREKGDDFSIVISDVIKSCVQKDPEKRSSMQVILEYLKCLLVPEVAPVASMKPHH